MSHIFSMRAGQAQWIRLLGTWGTACSLVVWIKWSFPPVTDFLFLVSNSSIHRERPWWTQCFPIHSEVCSGKPADGDRGTEPTGRCLSRSLNLTIPLFHPKCLALLFFFSFCPLPKEWRDYFTPNRSRIIHTVRQLLCLPIIRQFGAHFIFQSGVI